MKHKRNIIWSLSAASALVVTALVCLFIHKVSRTETAPNEVVFKYSRDVPSPKIVSFLLGEGMDWVSCSRTNAEMQDSCVWPSGEQDGCLSFFAYAPSVLTGGYPNDCASVNAANGVVVKGWTSMLNSLIHDTDLYVAVPVTDVAGRFSTDTVCLDFRPVTSQLNMKFRSVGLSYEEVEENGTRWIQASSERVLLEKASVEEFGVLGEFCLNPNADGKTWRNFSWDTHPCWRVPETNNYGKFPPRIELIFYGKFAVERISKVEPLALEQEYVWGNSLYSDSSHYLVAVPQSFGRENVIHIDYIYEVWDEKVPAGTGPSRTIRRRFVTNAAEAGLSGLPLGRRMTLLVDVSPKDGKVHFEEKVEEI
ncbi:MAG: hypothetical protein HUJ89_04450 [Bacteroidales bacterium]|nr:hypothetical protein [Bacteroidales bacterium]